MAKYHTGGQWRRFPGPLLCLPVCWIWHRNVPTCRIREESATPPAASAGLGAGLAWAMASENRNPDPKNSWLVFCYPKTNRKNRNPNPANKCLTGFVGHGLLGFCRPKTGILIRIIIGQEITLAAFYLLCSYIQMCRQWVLIEKITHRKNICGFFLKSPNKYHSFIYLVFFKYFQILRTKV